MPHADGLNENGCVAEAMLTLVDGDGRPFTGQVLLHIQNGQDVAPRMLDVTGPSVMLRVPFHDGVGDHYAISASSDGYRDNGCFFRADTKVLAEPKLLMIRRDPHPRFAGWEVLKETHPNVVALIGLGESEVAAEALYSDLVENRPDSLACFLNLVQAMAEIDLNGRNPLSYFKAICWDGTFAQDRFFGYVDPALISAVREAAEKGAFAEEKDCAHFHPGSTCSWKQIAFPVSNVQLTFHEGDRRVIDGVECVRIEPDIDLYRDLVEHGFGEVIPNLLAHELTSPYDVFSMRWTTAQDDHGPGFDPGYELA